MDNIQVLAKQMGVSESDVKSFAQSIINSMAQDGVVDAFLLMSEEDRSDVINSYAIHAARKMQIFVNNYLTNPEAAEAFRKTVRSII